MLDLASARLRMVQRQLRARGIQDERVLAAMARIPREAFVSQALEEFAYDDRPLPIEQGQTISQPFIVALMIEAAEIKPGERVLEIGAGSGYAAAVMSEIAERVYAIERHADLAEAARQRLHRLGYANVEIRTGNGSAGWAEAAPFDAIVVAAASASVPEALKRQLAIGGRLVMPVGATRSQRLIKFARMDQTRFSQKDLCSVAFVPFIGDDA